MINYWNLGEQYAELVKITGKDLDWCLKEVSKSKLNIIQFKEFYLCTGRVPEKQEIKLIKQFSIYVFCQFYIIMVKN
jgi:hypothetical protein